MNSKPVNDILFNFFLDMRKKDIDKRQRAQLLAKYLEDNNISQRQLAKELGIPHSTIQDWLMLNRISEEEYQKYIEEGMTYTDIYRMLRNNKQATTEDFDLLLFKNEVKKSISKYRSLIQNSDKLDTELLDDIKELVNILNRAMIHNERQLK